MGAMEHLVICAYGQTLCACILRNVDHIFPEAFSFELCFRPVSFASKWLSLILQSRGKVICFVDLWALAKSNFGNILTVIKC